MRNDDTTHYGQLIRTIREALGHSLAEAARITGVPKSTMSRLETGDSVLSIKRFVEICSAYGKDPTAVLSGRQDSILSAQDFHHVAKAVEQIELVIATQAERPGPGQIGRAVAEVLKLESRRLADTPGAEFDASRYRGLFEVMLE